MTTRSQQPDMHEHTVLMTAATAGDPFEDVQSSERYVSAEAYAHTKRLNMLFTFALAKRLAAERGTVNAVHPGLSWTQMTQSMRPETMGLPKPLWPCQGFGAGAELQSPAASSRVWTSAGAAPARWSAASWLLAAL